MKNRSGRRASTQSSQQTASTSQQHTAPAPRLISPIRAFIIGACGVALLCAVTPYNDFRLKNTFLYGNHLPLGGLFLFALLIFGIQPLLRRNAPQHAFRPGELLLIWAMLTCGAGLASSGLWRYLGPMVVAPAYYAGAGSRWLSAFRDTPDWLLLTRDPQSPLAVWFYHGLPFGETVPWGAWGRILLFWGIAFALITALSLGLCALFRRQWSVRERLTFPLAQLPIQIVSEIHQKTPLTSNPVFWVGCVTVILAHTGSTIHYFMPVFPDVLNHFDITSWQQSPPWDALGLPTLDIYYAVIGAIFLLPADVSLTLWFTFIALHLLRVLRAMKGDDALMIGPLNHEGAIGVGAFLVWGTWLIWIARPHWRFVWEAARHPRRVDEREEPLPARAALFLVSAGFAGLLVWMRAAGISWGIALLTLVLFCLILLVLTRIMAEAGLLFLMTPFIPTDAMAFGGTHYFTPTSASVTLQMEVVFMHDPREHIMPAIANAYAFVGESRLSPRTFTGGIALSIGVGFFVSFASYVWLQYRYGAITLDSYGINSAPHWSLDRALQYVDSPSPLHAKGIQTIGLGAILAALFIALKSRFLWWPFGPIGLAMGSTYAMNRIWFAVFLGWLCKVIVLRLGGLKMYKRALPFFLGLLLGEGLFGGAAAIWGMLTGVSAPPFLPT